MSDGTLAFGIPALFGGLVVIEAGTVVLFTAVRGPARGAIRRLGPHVGLTQPRLDRATSLLEHRGQLALAVGRATPSLRTLTVIAAAFSRLPARRALPLLILGGSVFIQLHFVLGYALGPLAEQAFRAATGPALVVAALLVAGAALYWLRHHRGRAAGHAFSEATCVACVAVHHMVPAHSRIDAHEVR